MADMATKNKSMNVVSNNTVSNLGKTKISDVCGVQSNNGLIDLDHNGLSNTSNNKLITICLPTDDEEEEDDLILVNNTRNELDSQEDKSLQELIESELALRICATSGNSDDTDDDKPNEMVISQPEITKKIILEPRQDTIDINTEFIVNEIEHYTLLGEPYEYSNGYASPDPKEVFKMVEPPEINDDKGIYDGKIGTLDSDITTTISGLPLPFSDNERYNQHNLEENQPISINTLSDSYIIEEMADEVLSKELSHQSVIDNYLQEEELLQSNKNSENLFLIKKELEMNYDHNQEDIQDNLEEDNLACINKIIYNKCDVELQKNTECSKTLPTYAFIESKMKNNQVNSIQDEQDYVDTVQEINESISLKEASDVDEKACSFYSTETKGSGNFVDYDENLESYNQSTVDVTNYKLKIDVNNQEDNWMTVEEAVKASTVDIVITQRYDSLQERPNEYSEHFYSQETHIENYLKKSKLEDENKELTPLATPDEISDISNACDDLQEQIAFSTLI